MNQSSQTDKPDPLQGRADRLVLAAKAASGPALASSRDKYPFVDALIITPEDEAWWEIIFTIAAVYIAAVRLRNLELGEARETALMSRVTDKLVEFNPNALTAFEDCKEVFGLNFDALTEKKHDPRFIASDSIGSWTAMHIMDRAPETEEEAIFVRSLGVSITHGFFKWWN